MNNHGHTPGCPGCDYGLLRAGAHAIHCRQAAGGETESEARERLRKENPLYTRHTRTQIEAMLSSDHPEWFDPSLRREAEDRGMHEAPWAETPLTAVLDYLRSYFGEVAKTDREGVILRLPSILDQKK